MDKSFYAEKRDYLFVDGYNVLHQWERYAFLLDEDLERARLAMMEDLAEYAHLTGQVLILVFDGYQVKKNPGEEFSYKGITVVFTKEFETADHFIEKELQKVGRHRNVRVATSDALEQSIVLASGGRRMSARELEYALVEAKARMHRDHKNDPKELSHFDEETLEGLLRFRKDLGE